LLRRHYGKASREFNPGADKDIHRIDISLRLGSNARANVIEPLSIHF
jgi:hypothetical protein